MIVTIIMLIVGLAIFIGGLYYLVKEKEDKESRRIYAITVAVGAIIAIGVLIKIAILGF